MNSVVQWLKYSTFGFVALISVTACSDDHFNVDSIASGEKSLWANIESNASLSDFAALLKRTKVMKDENDKSATLYASDLLKQSQSFTIWAPVNGSYNAKHWNDTLDYAASLRSQGTAASLKQALEIENSVWDQFVGNHLARFNYEAVGNNAEVRLINSKYSKYTGTTFNNIPVIGQSTLSNNGTLHIISGASPFAYNIYDYLSSSSALSGINSYIKDPSVDHNEFSETMSTPGAMNEQGNMVYIDSVYNRYNDLLNSSNAQIRNEDSTYVALLPTNSAWDEAINKVSKLFTYGNVYNWDFKTVSGGIGSFNKTGTNALLLNKAMVSNSSKTLADSLKDRRTREAIVTNLFFAPYRILGGQSMDSATLMNHFYNADSLISTTGTVFYNPAAVKGQPNAHANPVLAGIRPYRASNGYIFQLENFGFDPAYSWVREQKYQPTISYFVTGYQNATSTTQLLTDQNYNRYTAVLDASGQPMKDALGNTIMTGVKGEVENNTYQRFDMIATTSDMIIDFRVPEVYSAAYTIELVMAPSKINFDVVPDPSTDNEVVKFTAQIISDDDNVTSPTTYASQRVTIDQSAGQFSQDSVQVVKLWDNFTFKKCYVGLPSGYSSFARLRLTVPRLSTRPGAVQTARALNIISVRFRPYRTI